MNMMRPYGLLSLLVLVAWSPAVSATVITSEFSTIFRSAAEDELTVAAAAGAYYSGGATVNSMVNCEGRGSECQEAPFAGGGCVIKSKVAAFSSGPSGVKVNVIFTALGSRIRRFDSEVKQESLFTLRIDYTELGPNGERIPRTLTQERLAGELNVFRVRDVPNRPGYSVFNFSTFGLRDFAFSLDALEIQDKFQDMTLSLCDVAGGITAVKRIDIQVFN